MEIEPIKSDLGKTVCSVLVFADKLIDARPGIARITFADDDFRLIAQALNQYCIRSGIRRRGVFYYRGKICTSVSKTLSIKPEGVHHGSKEALQAETTDQRDEQGGGICASDNSEKGC